jgi:hypothetical protein
LISSAFTNDTHWFSPATTSPPLSSARLATLNRIQLQLMHSRNARDLS